MRTRYICHGTFWVTETQMIFEGQTFYVYSTDELPLPVGALLGDYPRYWMEF